MNWKEILVGIVGNFGSVRLRSYNRSPAHRCGMASNACKAERPDRAIVEKFLVLVHPERKTGHNMRELPRGTLLNETSAVCAAI